MFNDINILPSSSCPFGQQADVIFTTTGVRQHHGGFAKVDSGNVDLRALNESRPLITVTTGLTPAMCTGRY